MCQVSVGAHGIFRCIAQASLKLWHKLSCPVACGILVLQPRTDPVSPALEGRFLTTGLPGKPINCEFLQFQPWALSGSQLYILESAREF